MIFDTHTHYDDEAFNEDRDTILSDLQAQGIEKIINIGATLESTRATVELMQKYSFIYGAAGVHPEGVAKMTDESMDWLKELCRYNKTVAVGEIGLDYYWDEPDKEIQKYWFRRQLQLAREEKLPVVIHSRDAAKDTIDIMKEEHSEEIGGVIHCYSYSKETAKIFLDMGFVFGIGGVITFKNAKKLKEAVEYIPMDAILLETDCPYLAPEPYRGKRNNSLYLSYVVAKIAEIKGISTDKVEQITMENAIRVFPKLGF